MITKNYKVNYTIIKNFYNEIDTDGIINIINYCKENNDFFQLINYCIKYDIDLFKKNKKSIEIRNVHIIIKECISKKKSIIKQYIHELTDINKCNNVNIHNTLGDESKNVLNNLKEIDNIIELINETKFNNIKNYICKNIEYIAIYSN
jgi:hypothetical protein